MNPIVPRHLTNYSDPDYYIDTDQLMLHTLFELLIQFIETIETHSIVGFDTVEFNNRPLLDTLNELKSWYEIDYLPYWNGETMENWMSTAPEPIVVFDPIENSEYTSLKLEFTSLEHETQWNSMMDQWKEYERQFELEIQRQLHTLIDVRPYLWI